MYLLYILGYEKYIPKVVVSIATFAAPLLVASVASADPSTPITSCSFSNTGDGLAIEEGASASPVLNTNGTAAWVEQTYTPDNYSM